MAQAITPFLPENVFHIFNRGNAKEKIFTKEDNYLYFLKKYKEMLSPLVETYAYCLLPNHFHFLIQIKSEEEVFTFLKNENKLPEENITLNDFRTLNESSDGINYFALHVSKQFSNFFNGYAQAINKQNGRAGCLFQKSLKRKNIDDIKYLRDVILYIHLNPMAHQFCTKIEDWKYSSYHSLLSALPTLLKREYVIELFDNRTNFIDTHSLKHDNVITELMVEMEN